MQSMVDLDLAFSRCDTPVEQDQAEDRGEDTDKLEEVGSIRKGRSIFDKRTAQLGFVVASSIFLTGRIAAEKTDEEVREKLDEYEKSIKDIIEKLNSLSPDDLRAFLALDVLSEKLGGQKRSAVGRYEGELFQAAFKALIEEGDSLPSLETCWRG